jgi:hypothetical protein
MEPEYYSAYFCLKMEIVSETCSFHNTKTVDKVQESSSGNSEVAAYKE